MPDEALKLSWEQVRDLLRLAPEGKVYGVPRGGQIVAGLLGRAVDTPEEADVIVDDIVDSGATRKAWEEKTGKPFWALVDKVQNPDPRWVVFPWEASPEQDVEQNVTRLLQYIGEDPKRQGLLDTPKRVIKALRDMTKGYAQDPKEILARVFSEENHDGIVILDHIEFVSMCEHHMMAFMGHAHIGYIPAPGKGVVGISKLARLVDCFARRLQVQERMTAQIAQAIDDCLEPLGVVVMLEARHSCVCARGVGKQSSMMRTQQVRGVFMDKPEARAEFLSMVFGGQK